MSKLPQSVRVAGFNYCVEVQPSGPIDHEHYGVADHHKLVIALADDMPKQRQGETLFHECFHVAECACGEDFSEETVKRMARTLYAMLVDNPALVKFLMATGKQQ